MSSRKTRQGKTKQKLQLLINGQNRGISIWRQQQIGSETAGW